MLRRALLILLCAQFVLLVAFAVLMGGYALAAAAGDTLGAVALWWIAMGCLMLIVTDALLLVMALGIAAFVPVESRDRVDM
jgi:hypothetical protein